MIRKPGQRGPLQPLRNRTGEPHLTANKMRRYFAPASIMFPPSAGSTLTGNRRTAVTSEGAPNNTPNDQSLIQFNSGAAIWRFAVKFNNPPIIKATAQGVRVGGGGPVANEIYLQGPGTNQQVILRSTDPADNRFLHVTAHGNPD